MRRKASPARRRPFQQTTLMPPRFAPAGNRGIDSDDTLLTVAEAARILSVSRGLIYQMIRRGELPALAIHRVLRIRARDLDRFITDSDMTKEPVAADSERRSDSTASGGRLAGWKREHGRG